MRKKVLDLLKVYEEEISLVLWTAALLFIIRCGGMILNNMAETAFLKRYGVEFMPVVNMANAVATFFITGFLAAFLTRMPGARLLMVVFIFSGFLIAGVRMIIPFGFDLVYPFLFMLKSQFEMIQGMLFWNMCNDIFNTRQSKRLFPLLTAGGVIGLILSSFATPFLAAKFSLDNLLYIYLFTSLAAAAMVRSMGKHYPAIIFGDKPDRPVAEQPSLTDEFKKILPLIKESTLIKIVLLLNFMPNVVIPILNYQFNYAVNDQFATEGAMIQFFGYFKGSLNIISLFILLFVGRIYGKWGLPVALMFHPFNYMLAFAAFLFRFDVFSAMYARISTGIIRTTINVPANSILMGLFPESYRNLIRPFLRGTVVRAALFTGSSLILVFDALFHPRYLSLVALPFVLAWCAAPFILRSQYGSILQNLISNNLLDIKNFNPRELSQVFNHKKALADLEQGFLKARGRDAIWTAGLLKQLSYKGLDKLILQTLDRQNPGDQPALIKLMSLDAPDEINHNLTRFLDPEKPETTIAILKRLALLKGDPVFGPFLKGVDLHPFFYSPHPVLRGFACAGLYRMDPESHQGFIKEWLTASDTDLLQSGIISAGLSRNPKFIPDLLQMLDNAPPGQLICEIIIALKRLKAENLQAIALTYLFYPEQQVRSAALKSFKIVDDQALKTVLPLLDDLSENIRRLARTKIESALLANDRLSGQVMVNCLETPSSRMRKELFILLENLDIKGFDAVLFAKTQLFKAWEYLSMAKAVTALPKNQFQQLCERHLIEQQERTLESTFRVLAIHDRTGRMRTVYKGLYSNDTRQRSNAVELLGSILDTRTFNMVAPLLETPGLLALDQGEKFVKIKNLAVDGNRAISKLVFSNDWTDVIFGMGMAHGHPDLLTPYQDKLSQSDNPDIVKECKMILNKNKHLKSQNQSHDPKELTIGEKVLLLKEIEIFTGLKAAELAAIASVCQEQACEQGLTVIRQGQPGDMVFLVVTGQVAVIKEYDGKDAAVLDHMGPGDAFGEMALIEDAPRSATIKTTEPCRFLTLHKEEFKETVMEFPGIGLKICSVLSRRIRDLHEKFKTC